MNNGYAYGSNRPYYQNNLYVEKPTFATLTDADNVLVALKQKIKEKGYATASDFYKLVDGESVSGDSEIGWFDILDAVIRVSRYGYELSMPLAERIRSNPVRDALEVLENVNDEDGAIDAVDTARDYLRSAL